MCLAEKIVVLRKQKRLTQMELAEQLNVSRQAISRWEKADAIPSIDNLRAMSDIFGISVDCLLNDSEEILQERMAGCPNSEGHEGYSIFQKWMIILLCIIALVIAVVVFDFADIDSNHDGGKEEIPIENLDSVDETESTMFTFPIE